MAATLPSFFSGEATVKEKSMMYRTSLRQKMQGVSITAAVTSDETLSGKDRRHSVHVSTIYGIPRESFPFRGTHTGAACLVWALARTAEFLSKSATNFNNVPG